MAALLLVGALVVTAAPARAGVAQDLSGTARASVADARLGWDETTTVSGSGWAAGQTVDIILYAGGNVLASPTVSDQGTISATIRIPSNIGSSTEYRLAVQGFGGDGLYGYVELPITIVGPTPTIAIASRELGWNETTTVSGQRYKPGATITVSLFPDNTVLATTTANESSSFSVPVRIPNGLRSSTEYQMVVTGQGIDLLFHFDNLEVTIIGDRPTIELSKTRAARGESLTVSGRLFFRETKAEITLIPGFERLGSVTVAADGTFSTEVKIPDLAEGYDPHAIIVTGQGTDGLFAFLIDGITLGDPPTSSTARGSRGSTTSIDELIVLPGDYRRSQTTFERFEGDDSSDAGSLLLLLLLALLTLLALALLVLTRRDLRERLRLRWHELGRRVRVRLGRDSA